MSIDLAVAIGATILAFVAMGLAVSALNLLDETRKTASDAMLEVARFIRKANEWQEELSQLYAGEEIAQEVAEMGDRLASLVGRVDGMETKMARKAEEDADGRG